MATVSVVPDKFESGDFLGWLRHFDCCATANGWSADDKLKKLPAFLRGPAASYYFTLSDDNKQSYADLTKNLTVLLCPKVARENYFADFERRFLRQAEDPSLYLWDLQNLLGKADPDMAASARTALVTRQFMKGLPPDLRLRLLENNPTPDLKEMTTFVQRHRALYGTSQTDSVCSAADADVGAASHDSLRHSVKELTAAVAALTVNQSKLQSSVQAHQRYQQQQHPPPNGFPIRRSTLPRCFLCRQLGHIARECPWDAFCARCGNSGHSEEKCSSRYHLQDQTFAGRPRRNFNQKFNNASSVTPR